MRAVLLSGALLAVAACGQTSTPYDEAPAAETPAAPTTAAEATAQDTCGASQYASMVGQNLAVVTVPESMRTIAPDSVVTQDFRPDRINMIVDASGVILRFECY